MTRAGTGSDASILPGQMFGLRPEPRRTKDPSGAVDRSLDGALCKLASRRNSLARFAFEQAFEDDVARGDRNARPYSKKLRAAHPDIDEPMVMLLLRERSCRG